MIEQLLKTAARLGLLRWIASCLLILIIVLVLADWSAEAEGWAYLSAAGLSPLQITLAMIVAWLRNSTFWGWSFLVSMNAWAVWRAAIKRYPQLSEKS